MIRAIAIFASASAALLVAAPASAQSGAGPLPGSWQARPDEPGNPGTNLTSTAEQIRRASQEARDREHAALARYGRAVPAKTSEVVAQATIYDLAGEVVGKVESVDRDGAVVATAVGKVKVPLSAFGKNRQGLLVGVSKRDFEAQVTKAYAAPAG